MKAIVSQHGDIEKKKTRCSDHTFPSVALRKETSHLDLPKEHTKGDIIVNGGVPASGALQFLDKGKQ